jgi:hypothetical protein
MCLVTSEPRRYVRRETDYYAPVPVSNYHAGPPRPRNSVTYVHRTSSSIPRERVSYRSSRTYVR